MTDPSPPSTPERVGPETGCCYCSGFDGFHDENCNRSPASSLPAVPANLGFLITMLKEKAISFFVARDRRGESEKEEAEYLAARSHLENLFLEQQREIERLRQSHRGTPDE